MSRTTVLISAPDAAAAEALRVLLDGERDFDIVTQVQAPGQGDPLLDAPAHTGTLVLQLGDRSHETLRALAARTPSARPPTLVIGSSDAFLLREALRAGARDYLSPPVMRGDLLAALQQIEQERRAGSGAQSGRVIAVVGTKGGSGASLVAANLAHMLAIERKSTVALLDLDLQFGALPLAFDLLPRNSLLDALAGSDRLDAVALDGYACKHASGVHVLSAMSDRLPAIEPLPAEAGTRLLTLLRQVYPLVIVDVPRQLDIHGVSALAQADQVLLVTQQSLAHVRQARAMLHALTRRCGVPRARISLLVNRYNRRSDVTLEDIAATVDPPAIRTLPDDFVAASGSLDRGTPLFEYKRSAALTQALRELAVALAGAEADAEARPAPRGRGLSLVPAGA